MTRGTHGRDTRPSSRCVTVSCSLARCRGGALVLLALMIAAPVSRAQSADDFAVLSNNVDQAAASTLDRLLQEPAPGPGAESVVPLEPIPQASANEVVLSSIRSSGMPVKLLVSLVHVESGGNPRALSSKGALGLWQLMPDTARRFGLTVTPSIDHRIDPKTSTAAALQYLAELYRRFGDWQLTLAAYNAGEGAVERAIRRGNTRDFYQLARLKLLPPETREYVTTVLSKAGWAH